MHSDKPCGGSALGAKGRKMDCMRALGNRRAGATPGLARRSFGWVCPKTGRSCMSMQKIFRRPLFCTELDYPQRLLKARFRSHPANQNLRVAFATARPDRRDRHCAECTAAIVPRGEDHPWYRNARMNCRPLSMASRRNE